MASSPYLRPCCPMSKHAAGCSRGYLQSLRASPSWPLHGLALAGAALTLSSVLAAPARAASTITQTSAINLTGASQSFSFDAFDAALGTLQSVTLSVTGTFGGSFSITNNGFESTTLSDAFGRIFGGWTGGPANTLLISDGLAIAGGYPKTIASFSTSSFNVLNSEAATGGVSYTSSLGYFSGGSPLAFTIFRSLNIAASGGEPATGNSLTFGGSGSQVVLTYNYTPDSPVPIPLPVPILGATLGYGFLRRQRQRLKANKL